MALTEKEERALWWFANNFVSTHDNEYGQALAALVKRLRSEACASASRGKQGGEAEGFRAMLTDEYIEFVTTAFWNGIPEGQAVPWFAPSKGTLAAQLRFFKEEG